MLKTIHDTVIDLQYEIKKRMQEFWLKRYCNGVVGVPITFLDKYNPEQFEIVGLAPERLSEEDASLQTKRYINAIQHKKDGSICGGNKVNDGPTLLHKQKPNKFPYYTSPTVGESYLEVLYARILMKRMKEGI